MKGLTNKIFGRRGVGRRLDSILKFGFFSLPLACFNEISSLPYDVVSSALFVSLSLFRTTVVSARRHARKAGEALRVVFGLGGDGWSVAEASESRRLP